MGPPPPFASTVRQAEDSISAPVADAQRLCVDTIRTLTMDAVQAADSGHPGMPMAMAPVAYLLFARLMRHNPRDPEWPDRDRFVLSAGHGSMLLYSALHLSGYDLSLSDLRDFRQWQSRTPGHPERGLTPGVETSTGPLGQGFANGVGMAMAERFLRERYGPEAIDHRTFAICSDGDLMEGVASEAASLAGHLQLGRLVYVYDDNGITIDGSTELAFSGENVELRFGAYGWQVLTVADANDLVALESALREATSELERPSLIRVRSTIGYASPTKQGTAAAHGAPLGEEEVRATKSALGWDPDQAFHVPDQVYEAFSAVARGERLQEQWRERFEQWRALDAGRAAEWDRAWAGRPEPELAGALPRFDRAERPAVATRDASGAVMQACAGHLPTMIGGSADLAGSVKTGFSGERTFGAERAARNVAWGVREHAMAAAVNGLALHGGIVRPFGSTFLVFADYMRPAIRLSALMELPVVWVFSHDSLGVGEDGPTHQPVEHLAALRLIPGLTVMRPADAAETAEAWRVALEEIEGPTCLVLTRQKVPVLDRAELAGAERVGRGAYVLAGAPGDDARAVIVASGSEVSVALSARDLLALDGVEARVVSMPSWELFAQQDEWYRDSVLPAGVPKVSVEAGASFGWERWVDRCVAVDRFGASAPGPEVMRALGITPEAVVAEVRGLLRAA
ncbi:MAG: transketolase [Solirubrobacteraceae bacterium]|nr:transketolase [Solirubrobacteraceae bacterium]